MDPKIGRVAAHVVASPVRLVRRLAPLFANLWAALRGLGSRAFARSTRPATNALRIARDVRDAVVRTVLAVAPPRRLMYQCVTFGARSVNAPPVISS
jgi:hypothetical protein